jgi:3-methyladenine DNA glycosylase AlkD
MNLEQTLILLKQKSNTTYLAGMKRFGIDDTYALGIPVPELRKLSKVIKKDHALALALLKTNLHEARLLASMVGDPALFTEEHADNG